MIMEMLLGSISYTEVRERIEEKGDVPLRCFVTKIKR